MRYERYPLQCLFPWVLQNVIEILSWFPISHINPNNTRVFCKSSTWFTVGNPCVRIQSGPITITKKVQEEIVNEWNRLCYIVHYKTLLYWSLQSQASALGPMLMHHGKTMGAQWGKRGVFCKSINRLNVEYHPCQSGWLRWAWAVVGKHWKKAFSWSMWGAHRTHRIKYFLLLSCGSRFPRVIIKCE